MSRLAEIHCLQGIIILTTTSLQQLRGDISCVLADFSNLICKICQGQYIATTVRTLGECEAKSKACEDRERPHAAATTRYDFTRMMDE